MRQVAPCSAGFRVPPSILCAIWMREVARGEEGELARLALTPAAIHQHAGRRECRLDG